MPPVIGLTTYDQMNKAGFPIAALMHRYIEAIQWAGGLPVLLPSTLGKDEIDLLLSRLDGVLFTGGGDILPERYGGMEHPTVDGVDSRRDEFEFLLARALFRKEKPFLGICRGLQLINVAAGGTLYTHLPEQRPSEIRHNRDSATERTVLAHAVTLSSESRLAVISGEMHFQVNSLHHQGIDRLAPEWQAVGYASDGLIEAIELPGHPFGLAVQWHPEWLTDFDHARNLFAAFVQAADRAR
ncbi:MAG: gamma-glutamyl-gamma-aminobutyrate hydrolase family protein [Anaerolineales bacterium]|nr:gamma-glutamyl-gamma-aminobutyrate hydrolase family protein [Anaerolineales bacterium]